MHKILLSQILLIFNLIFINFTFYLYLDKSFDWNKYLEFRHAEEVPEDFFYHVRDN